MKRRNKNRSILLRISAFIVVALLSVNLGILQVELANKLSQSKENETEIAEKSKRVEELTNLLEKSNDPESIEDAARDRLGYVLPNEKVFYDIG
jgi:cell division protein FtsB